MNKRNQKRTKRIKKMITVCTLSSIIFVAASYAWFIGMRTVNVSSFDVEIATTDSLLLSLDGKTWGTTVSINKDNFNTASYAGNTNTWGGKGLIPVSSIGEMDNTVSTMKMYEKASLTATHGGYRLMASRIHNYDKTNAEGKIIEQDGYVAFDLFVKNFSGEQYIADLNELDEEAIYLTTDSEVTVASTGVANTGIENSVRVAFAQIGRVSGKTTDVNTITGISCSSDSAVTGICRTAQIWEPNDKAHVTDAISWYNASCKTRKSTGTDLTLEASYNTDTACASISNGNAYPTYAIKKEIASSDNVDIYDGTAYNTYTESVYSTDNTNGLLYEYNYFTDTEKMYEGTARPTFITLAPNSITKVRVYIYIEGQDIDNYDFASIGKKFSVKFGFTKERFTEEDFNYEGPAAPDTSVDSYKPVITLKGDAEVTVAKGAKYVDAGATASDKYDDTEATEDLTSKIIVTNPVDTNKPGTYTVTYMVSDWAGNYADQVSRTVIVTE